MNLEAVYPNPDDPNDEMSFEELQAKGRGWTGRDWVAENGLQSREHHEEASSTMEKKRVEFLLQGVEQSSDLQKLSETRIDSALDEEARSQKSGRPKKLKIREVKAEAQTGIAPQCHFYK